jgi:hypothetical protein
MTPFAHAGPDLDSEGSLQTTKFLVKPNNKLLKPYFTTSPSCMRSPQVSERNDFGLDEALLKVSVDDTARLRCLRALRERSRTQTPRTQDEKRVTGGDNRRPDGIDQGNRSAVQRCADPAAQAVNRRKQKPAASIRTFGSSW